MWIQQNESGRVIACSAAPLDPACDRRVEAVPEEFPGEDITCWAYDGSDWTHHPAEDEPQPVSLEQRVEETEAALIELAALIGGDGA